MTGKPGKTRPPAKEKETKENNWTRKIFGVRRRRRTQKDNIRRGKSDDEQKGNIRDGDSTVLYAAYTVDTVDTNLRC